MKTFILSLLLVAVWIISDLILLGLLVGYPYLKFLDSRESLPYLFWLIGTVFLGVLLALGIVGTILHLLDGLSWLRGKEETFTRILDAP